MLSELADNLSCRRKIHCMETWSLCLCSKSFIQKLYIRKYIICFLHRSKRIKIPLCHLHSVMNKYIFLWNFRITNAINWNGSIVKCLMINHSHLANYNNISEINKVKVSFFGMSLFSSILFFKFPTLKEKSFLHQPVKIPFINGLKTLCGCRKGAG